MKDNLNIEELFKEKFDSFEGEVRPDAWTNIQQGINLTGSAAATSTGMSVFMKTALIAGGIVAASVTGFYLFSDDTENETTNGNQIVQIDNEDNTPIEENVLETDYKDLVTNVDRDNTISEENGDIVNNETLQSEEEPVNDSGDETVVNENGHNESGVVEGNQSNDAVDNAAQTDDNTASSENSDSDSNDATNQEDVASIDENSNTQEEETQIEYPTGRMEFFVDGKHAPVNCRFTSNALNHNVVKWEFGDGSVGVGEAVEHTYEKPGMYTVKMIIYGNGEFYEESQVIEIESKSGIDNIPNIITPNGDRINDFFCVSTTDIETFFISIYDDKGKEVFQSNDAEFRWYGLNKSGEKLAKGQYTYVIIAKGLDGAEFKIPGQIYIQ